MEMVMQPNKFSDGQIISALHDITTNSFLGPEDKPKRIYNDFATYLGLEPAEIPARDGVKEVLQQIASNGLSDHSTRMIGTGSVRIIRALAQVVLNQISNHSTAPGGSLQNGKSCHPAP